MTSSGKKSGLIQYNCKIGQNCNNETLRGIKEKETKNIYYCPSKQKRVLKEICQTNFSLTQFILKKEHQSYVMCRNLFLHKEIGSTLAEV